MGILSNALASPRPLNSQTTIPQEYHNIPPPMNPRPRGPPYLCRVGPVIHRHLETPPQRALGVPAPEQLPHLPREPPHLGLRDLGLRRVQRRRVKVGGRVLLQRVDVDGAPGVAERGGGVLLDDRHCCRGRERPEQCVRVRAAVGGIGGRGGGCRMACECVVVGAWLARGGLSLRSRSMLSWRGSLEADAAPRSSGVGPEL